MKKALSIVGVFCLWLFFLFCLFLLIVVFHVEDEETIILSVIDTVVLIFVPVLLTCVTILLRNKNKAIKEANQETDRYYADINPPLSEPTATEKPNTRISDTTIDVPTVPIDQHIDPMNVIDSMTGSEFEEYCAALLINNGFKNVYVSGKSGDQGVDITATKDGIRYAIQCKCYSSDLGNTPVQEVYAGKNFYNCHVGVVMTNRHFTNGAIDLARSTGVLLWDRDKLKRMLTDMPINGIYSTKYSELYCSENTQLHVAIEIVLNIGQASVSLLQRRLRIGYPQAARLIDQMEELGIIGPFEGSNPRQVLITKQQWQEMQNK